MEIEPMLVFICWSGDKSKAIAEFIKELFNNILPRNIKIFISEDIPPGDFWPISLQQKLVEASFGIVCITNTNQTAPWMLYEAGCISNKCQNKNEHNIIPVLIDIPKLTDPSNPLSQYQYKQLSIESLKEILNKILIFSSSNENTIKKYLNKFDKISTENNNKLKNILEQYNYDTFTGKYDHSPEKISNTLKAFICKQQSEIIQYLYFSSKSHKELRKYIDQNKQYDLQQLDKHITSLMETKSDGMKNMFDKTIPIIQKMFSDRNKHKPRICLKVPDKIEGCTIIRALIREEENNYYSNGICKVNENTGYNHLLENGTKYYCCNNIPEFVKNGDYKNPRIIQDKVKNYNKSNSEKCGYDIEWAQCWTEWNTHHEENMHIYYKSTLIIPITLSKSQVSNQFKRELGMTYSTHQRTIFGYLCFDHIDTNYFDPYYDSLFGYIFADIFSLYLLIDLMHVQKSGTYQTAIDELNRLKP